jgi:arylsulfatase A-like enzyme
MIDLNGNAQRRAVRMLHGCAIGLACCVVALGAEAARASRDEAKRTQLVIVVDGLRPDYVTPELMPRLAGLGQRGIVFTAHHSVFPTVTRVNAASFVTGSYPETHGLMGNSVHFPAVDARRVFDTGSREDLESLQTATGPVLIAPSLGEILEQSGRKLLVVSSGTSGSAWLLNHAARTSATIHAEFTRPASLAEKMTAALGPAPKKEVPNDAQNARSVDAYLRFGLGQFHPDVTLMWLSDPDTTAHARGIGVEATRRALQLVDAQIGRIEDALQTKGLLARTNIIVTSDHGFSTHTGELNLPALVAPFARTIEGVKDIVVAEGAIYMRGGDAERVGAIVKALQARPEVGAIFTAPSAEGAWQGRVPGTLSFAAARWNHARAADILVSANWTHEKNAEGYAGTTTQRGTAGHGTSSPYDVHNTLIAIGPDFRERTVSRAPTGNVDIAPTVLRLLGLSPPRSMTGRVIEEGLRSGPSPDTVRVEHATETVKTADGSYELTIHFSSVAGSRYFDHTEVKRR